MNTNKGALIRTAIISAGLGLCLALTPSVSHAVDITSSTAATQSAAVGTNTASRAMSQAQGHPEVEGQRSHAEQQAGATIDKDAVSAVEETQNAVKAIADGKIDDAIAAIERATGKIDILVARKPASGLIPVDAEVQVIDTAPRDAAAVRDIAKQAGKALEDKDYPQARVLLEGLTSEIRVRTYHVPLATYPQAMKEAARLLEEKKTREASAVLTTALNTLVVIDRGTPMPLLLAQSAIAEAQSQRDKDKAAASKSLATAKDELGRAKLLGYAGNDPEYDALNKSISELEKQVPGDANTTSMFENLKAKVTGFLKKLSESAKQAL